VGEGRELERALVDVTGTGKTVPSCREKRFEKKLNYAVLVSSGFLSSKKGKLFVLYIPSFTLFLFSKSVCSLWFYADNDILCIPRVLKKNNKTKSNREASSQ